MEKCFHCGDDCRDELILHREKNFCCTGCKTVFDILQDNDLSYYYDLEKNPGISPKVSEDKYDFLQNESIQEKLLDFNDGNHQIVSFVIPSIHCSSCIWILENLNKLNKAVNSSQVDFPKKTVRISFSSKDFSLRDLVLLLSRLGYDPYISLEDYDEKKANIDRSLIYKLGVAGFAFGNVMFLSFPEYFEVEEFWLEQYKGVFRWLMFAFSLPVVLYSGWDYFTTAYKGLRSKMLNIDIPIALGIAVLFLRSSAEIILDLGTGFFDSLTGLVFFLLLGRFFQQKTYAYLSFERDYKSYFPIAVTRINTEEGKITEEQVQVYEIEKGDRIIIRNEELIPMDAILIKGNALIDYSFVTGEAEPVEKISGDKLFAGGRQQGGIIEIEALKPVKQSYLTQLWSDEVFSKDKRGTFQTLTNKISRRFTTAVLSIAFIATLFWLIYDPSKALNVFTAVLIIACPCAIALAAPFTLGNLLRIFGSNKLYLKEASVIEQIAEVDTIVFDKTGTITSNKRNTITYEGIELNPSEEEMLGSSLRASNHPLSRALYELLKKHNIATPDEFKELTGKGIESSYKGSRMKIGSESFVRENASANVATLEKPNKTAVHVSTNNNYKGCYVFQNAYREGISELFEELGQDKELVILSGDNDGEKENLQRFLPEKTQLFFNQKPQDKLDFIKKLQQQGKNVMMVGDGLNDAGALAQSNVGFVVSENINVFSPACDGILDAERFKSFSRFLQLSTKGIQVIKWSFLLSLCYNIIGLAFAVTGHLSPIVAAILMPLSSISIVVFTSIVTYRLGKKLKSE
ncbi:heavy metal translocating P-type ATPase metal-binding domain-containing protein [Salegentibacter sp. F188]|uniref:Heavy metal translocating P-type ATPase metal-binding domain-containing protein n=1 Tax=Autumnicola patrickiae TaxID=3075591 RepID=A0ABU3E3S3_9FLAO|nr:heavy metal translocating P-type ATPase metal-binding domain-containing protein [Salegentibacter sp. F188]MDT0690616.1 heavy metal translocating P-type ATPase metal-binding domain-containing protein [Salegentibacter sp. F188]